MATIRNVNSLFAKKWAGKEVGSLIINCLTEAVQHRDNSYNPKFTTNEIERMTKGFRSTQDIEVYRNYVAVYNSFLCGFNDAQYRTQQAGYAFYRVRDLIVNTIQSKEEIKTPAIVTQKQADDYVKQAAPALSGHTKSYINVVYRTLLHFIETHNSKPELVPQIIKETLETYKKESLANDAVKNSLNMPRNEEDENNRKPTEELLHNLEKIEKWKGLYTGELTLEEAYDLVEPNKRKPIEELTKYDFVAGEYRCIFASHYLPPASDNEVLKYFRLFVADFPELFKAILEELSKFKELEDISNLPIENYAEKCISCGTLAKAGIADYASRTYSLENAIKEVWEEANNNDPESEDSKKLFTLYLQARRWGVAVIQESTENIDQNGHYSTHRERALFERNPKTQEEIREIVKKSLIPPIKFVLSYNAVLELVAESYGISELTKLKQNTDEFLHQAESLNVLFLFLIYRDKERSLEANYYYSEEWKEKIAGENPPPSLLDIESCKPTVEAIEEAKSWLRANKITLTPVFLDRLILIVAENSVLKNAFLHAFRS